MSDIILGMALGATASVVLPKRVASIEMVYTTGGKYDNVILGVCVDRWCNVTYVDADGTTNTVTISANDIVIGRSVTVNSGRMFIIYAKYVGMI